jgi:hypothetical protein
MSHKRPSYVEAPERIWIADCEHWALHPEWLHRKPHEPVEYIRADVARRSPSGRAAHQEETT